MIKVIDIQNHIAKELKKEFPSYDIHVEDNQKDIKKPAFFVSVRPLLTIGTMRYKNKLVNVDIRFLSKNETHRENIIMAEKLEDMFHLTLEVGSRQLYIEDLSMAEVDTTLNLAFTLDYNVYRDMTRVTGGATEYMEELDIDKGDDI